MPPPKPLPDDDERGTPGPPTTPRRPSALKRSPDDGDPPRNRPPSAGHTPKSAPAAQGEPGTSRKRSQSMRPQPTLLGDFLLGKQSPARVAAARASQRRKSMDATAALAEMRRSSVQRLQQPGGVRDRVKAWQKANAGAMVRGNPESTPSEPTDVAVQVAAESVTEEDRIRIKSRKKARRRTTTPKLERVEHEHRRPPRVGSDEEEEEEEEEDDDDDDNGGPVGGGPRLNAPPKKRIVSDDNWRRRKNPPGPTTPKDTRPSGGSTLPKNFLQKTAANPSIHSKIQEWATKLETLEDPGVGGHRARTGERRTVEGDGARSSRSAPDDGLRVRPVRPGKASETVDDGIRTKPARKRGPKRNEGDDGIRIKPRRPSLQDEGTGSRPTRKGSMDTVQPTSPTTSAGQSHRVLSASRDRPSERTDDVDEPESVVNTPTKPSRARQPSARQPRESAPTTVGTQIETHAEDLTETRSWSESSDPPSGEGVSPESSYKPSSAPAKSLADIPFGFSAFSELDMPMKRGRAQRNPSFKAVPKVLKKVVSEGKKMLEKNDTPKPVINQPPSIESWLSNTVDPFVDAPTVNPKRKSVEEGWKKDAQKRSSSESREKEAALKEEAPVRAEADLRENQENADPRATAENETAGKAPPSTPRSTGLKRSGATRSPSSPLKSGGKRNFRDVLREAFRGESGGHKLPPVTYPSCEDDRDEMNSESEIGQGRRHSSGGSTAKRSPSPDSAFSFVEGSTITDGDYGDSPRRRPPPTTGLHELSTIVSEETLRSHESDTMSTVSQTTVTQATAVTGATNPSRQKSQKTGLKRRLTKHSDLVSVLSLPDDGQLPARTKSIRVARSLHRKTSKLDNATLDDLLQEFAEDENLYQRELKTLVDGVVPVLLTQFVHGERRNAAALFGRDSGLDNTDSMASAVVNMGIALEKLKNFHRRVPLHDAQRLLNWLEAVYPVYNNYLDVWRLGFQDIIVNLAPVTGRLDDEDSLVGAMARNEAGDVLDENGERVDVAHLLKRPLIRVKWLFKFAKGASMILGGHVAKDMVDNLETLVDKARRRHREEMARKADEDASATDTTRTRNLRHLSAADNVVIDQTRQVLAKDCFAMDLSHSNGQRLECQVELIMRDKPSDRQDVGDVLIRETGGGGRSWLLFPPVLSGQISARKGESPRMMVAMVRGVHDGEDWYQLMTLVADHEDTVAEWLDLLGTTPIPPGATYTALVVVKPAVLSPSSAEADVPVGEPRIQRQLLCPPSRSSFSPSPGDGTVTGKSPSRYHHHHQRNQSLPSNATLPQPAASPASRSPSYGHQRSQSTQLQPREEHPPPRRRVDPSCHRAGNDVFLDPSEPTKAQPNAAPLREDGAPPPPIHRTLGPAKPPAISSSAELSAATSRIKRRTSSPLKHEYHPSDGSSDESSTLGSSSSDGESSNDELEEEDVPDAIPAISIKAPLAATAESVVSDCSLTPSNSASQADHPGRADSPEFGLKFLATISYWNDKRGTWKELVEEASSIVVTPGLIEAFPLRTHAPYVGADLHASGTSDVVKGDNDAGASRPHIALDLTPLVMIRKSTSIDLEIRSPVRSYSRYNHLDKNLFRFRATSPNELAALYNAVHSARLNNAKFKALEEEARFRSFGQPPPDAGPADGGGGDDTSSRRRHSWFGRKNSYRASARAPSQSQGSVSSGGVSASSFLRRLTGGANLSFNIDKSSVDKQSSRASGSGATSLYTSGSSSASPLRSPSVSLAESSSRGVAVLGTDNFKIRCHLQISPSRWEDHGNCLLSISRPPPGVRQELALYHGMEKRVIVTTIPKKSPLALGKDKEKPLVVLDVVVGSGCFKRLAARGIILNVWEDLRDENNRVGAVPRAGGLSGKVKKWCFQCGSVAEASWIHGLVAQEVVIA